MNPNIALFHNNTKVSLYVSKLKLVTVDKS